jgi:hypothetical protein
MVVCYSNWNRLKHILIISVGCTRCWAVYISIHLTRSGKFCYCYYHFAVEKTKGSIPWLRSHILEYWYKVFVTSHTNVIIQKVPFLCAISLCQGWNQGDLSETLPLGAKFKGVTKKNDIWWQYLNKSKSMQKYNDKAPFFM